MPPILIHITRISCVSYVFADPSLLQIDVCLQSPGLSGRAAQHSTAQHRKTKPVIWPIYYSRIT